MASRADALLSAVVVLGMSACAAASPTSVAPVEARPSGADGSGPRSQSLPLPVAPSPAPAVAPSPAPEVPPSPAAAAAASPAPASSAADATLCSQKCAGRTTQELTQALQQRGALARRCYNDALKIDRHLEGHMLLHVRVGEDGSACAVRTARTAMPPEMTACAESLFTGGTYPPPTGGCIDVTIPLSFVAPSGAPDAGAAPDGARYSM